MILPCPNPLCPYFRSKTFVKKDGQFYRSSESRYIQRFKCNKCGKKFSHATRTLEFGQKKRRVNSKLRELLCGGVSMRRAAVFLRINRKTVERKVAYLAKKARLSQTEFLKSIRGKVTHLQFDDMITSEHTKMKPLTITLAVDAKRRHILGAEVAPIGAFGHLAELSRRKYGTRLNRHQESLATLFEKISPTVAVGALIESDEHKLYRPVVGTFLPGRKYEQFPGGRGAIVGQGELKKLAYDPLFILNHTCAMLRANINRLIRKTWCTTKDPLRLQMHLDLFIDYYNQKYLNA